MTICLNPAQLLPSFDSRLNLDVDETQLVRRFRGTTGALLHHFCGEIQMLFNILWSALFQPPPGAAFWRPTSQASRKFVNEV